MIYLFFQTWIWLLLAGLLGLLVGWLIWGKGEAEDCSSVQQQLDECKRKYAELESVDQSSNQGSEPDTLDTDVSTQTVEVAEPDFLDEPDGEADDLKRISGIGPVLEKTLNNLGIFHFSQIASFTSENIDWVNNYLSFSGRIERENWVVQAAALVADNARDSEKQTDKSDSGDAEPV